jgi:glutamate synthase (NADPH/NADH) small chain
MMAAVAELTKPYAIPTEVSLNALMVDGTGMCGACRVTVNGETRFACMEGPDFDGHKVDFAELRARQTWYKKEEALVQEPNDACVFEHVRSAGEPGPGKAELDWNAVDLLAIKPSQKRLIPRQDAACQPPEVRRQNFCEVSLGLSAEQAKLEAARCLDCKVPHCVEGCPVGIDIPAFLKQIVAGDVMGAAATIKQSSSLPAVCGRVCPQEKQCEKVCVTGIKGESVAIGRLERYAADYQLAAGIARPPKLPDTGKSIGIVGAGPAGLTVAGELILKGHRVTVYEALYKPGGVLLYGIPEFRLPNAIVDQEVEVLKDLGVEFVCNTIVGRSITVDELRARHDALFLGTGAGLPKMMEIPGENLKGVYTANEFLTRVNLMRADLFPSYTTPVTIGKRVVVVGCGDTAMDASRTAIRLGPQAVNVVYRRTRAEATARLEEFDHAVEEGIIFQWLKSPIRIVGNEEGWVTGLEVAIMALSEPGPDGRRAVTDTGEREIVPCDTIVTALGFGVNPLIPKSEPRLKTNKWGVVVVDEGTGETSMPGIFAGGDLITGGATVILAMGQGRRAAAAMHDFLKGAKVDGGVTVER